MNKEKTIHIRVSDTLYDRLSKSAETCEVNLSGYSRKVLKNYVKTIENPFRSNEFLHMAQWLFTVRDENSEALIFDAKHYLDIIKKYQPFFDDKLKGIFDNVIKDINRFIKDYDKDTRSKDYAEFYSYSFGDKDSLFYLDYDALQKYF